MAAPVGLQIARHSRPDHAKQHAREQHQGQHGPAGQHRAQPQSHQGGAQPAQSGLTLATDIEQTGMKSHGDGQSGKDKAGGVIQRVTQAPSAAKSAVDQRGKHLRRVLPDQGHHAARGQQRDGQAHHRQQRHIGPARQSGRCTHTPAPAIKRPKRSCEHSAIAKLPVIRPWYITNTRSDSASISSSSLDTTSTAQPASRMARSCP